MRLNQNFQYSSHFQRFIIWEAVSAASYDTVSMILTTYAKKYLYYFQVCKLYFFSMLTNLITKYSQTILSRKLLMNSLRLPRITVFAGQIVTGIINDILYYACKMPDRALTYLILQNSDAISLKARSISCLEYDPCEGIFLHKRLIM